MSEKIKGLRSSFNKNLNNLNIYKSSNVKDNKIYVSALIIDIVCATKKSSKFLPGRDFNGGLFIICGIEKIKSTLPIEIRSMSYEQFRQNYGSDDNIIGRTVTIETSSLDDFSIMAGKVYFSPPYENNQYENEDVNVPVSFGFTMGITSRREDRMFYNAIPSEGDGETWQLLK